MIRRGANAEESRLRPPPVKGQPDVAIRINRNLFGATLGDSELTKQLTPVLAKVLEARIFKTIGAKRQSNDDRADDSAAKWSVDQHWLAMDFSD